MKVTVSSVKCKVTVSSGKFNATTSSVKYIVTVSSGKCNATTSIG